MRNKIAGAVLLCLFGLADAAPITNSDVLELLAAGMSEATILQAIDSAEAHRFDTKAAALVKMKKAGASEAIIQKLLAHAAGRTSEATATTGSALTTAPAQPVTGGQCPVEMPKEGIFVRADKRIVQLPYQNVAVDMSSKGALLSALTFGATKSDAQGAIQLPGARSATRLRDRSVQFIDLLVPTGRADSANQITVVRFKATEAGRAAVLVKMRSSATSVISGAKADTSMTEFAVPVTMERVAVQCNWAGKTYDHLRARPSAPLENGEYAYIAGGSSARSVTVADFGID